MKGTPKDTAATETLYRTTNYDQFDLASENREIDRALVRDLTASMERNGFMKSEPVRCERRGDRLWLWDGQHRLAAAKNLGIAVWYRVMKYDPQLLIDINRPKRTWKPLDYLHHYRTMGLKDYERLAAFMGETGFPISQAISLLSGKVYGASQWHMGIFNKGEFKILNEELAYRVAAIANMIKAAGFRWSRDGIVIAVLAKLCQLPNFDEKRLPSKLSQLVGRYPLPPRGNVLVVEMFEEIYNYHATRTGRVYLKTELLKAGLLREGE